MISELRDITEEMEEKEKQLKIAREQNDLLHIPIADVTMTGIKLGGGSFGGEV